MALLACLATAHQARAHGTPVDLEHWGDFPPAVAACQRAIGAAGAACGLHAWRLRRDCALTALQGGVCDAQAVELGVQQARLKAQNAAESACTQMQVNLLQFLDVSEALRDVNTFCRDLDSAATSLMLDGWTEELIAAGDRACVETTTRSVSKLLAIGFRSRQRLLDRIALAPFTPARKRLMRSASTSVIATAVAGLAIEIERACPGDVFARRYAAQTPAEILGKIGTRADCLAGQTYAQSGVICPLATCGNRMVEPGEECDDGNADAGDDCSADCQYE
ncbi:MAG: DUF4215 domain-containing protein [bacterium]